MTDIEASGFEKLSEEAFRELYEGEVSSPELLERIIIEASRRFDEDGNDDIDELLENFVHLQLELLRVQFNNLFSIRWTGPEVAHQEYSVYVQNYLELSDPGTDTELDWPWPITEPSEVKGSGGDIKFPNSFSGLRLLGYRTGKTHGLSDDDRKELLDHFFRSELPEVVSQYFGTEYDEPGSEKRLKKMANVIAGVCRNFKKNDPVKFNVAIEHYEEDLNHLKQSYYKAGMFPWPDIEI